MGTQVAYTIRYLKEGTGEALLPAYSGTGVVGNSLAVTAPAIDGYTALAPTSYTITLNAEVAEERHHILLPRGHQHHPRR